jgi:hypothetical protein
MERDELVEKVFECPLDNQSSCDGESGGDLEYDICLSIVLKKKKEKEKRK